jgi:hypothetical protein
MIIGSKKKIAFVIGKKQSNTPFRKVEIFLAGKLVTGRNNMVYLPSYTYAMECQYKRLKRRGVDYEYIFLSFDDTTNSFSTRAIVSNGVVIVKQFLDNTPKIIVTIPIGQLLSILKRTANILRKV